MNRILIRHIGFSLVAAVLMLAGSTVFGQNDSPYVIKIKQGNQDHYLAHVNMNNGTQWVVKDTTKFSPYCLWYSGIEQNISGTNHNYYFDDGANLRFLSAPMSPNGSLGLSDNLPATYLLSNTDTIYYFYDWDSDNTGNGGGVARGHQYFGYNQEQCNECGASWEGGNTNECWRVYWIAYSSSRGWELTSKSYYDIDEIDPAEDGVGGRFRLVTVEDIKNTVSGGLADLSGFDMNFNENQPLAASVILPYNYKSYTHYSFEENGTSHHYYYDNADHNAAPTEANGSAASVASYEWTLSGPGAAFLSFAEGSMVDIISTSTPILYYRVENTHGDTQATLKLKVTYDNGTTQETSALVTVKTRCQNPEKLEGSPIVNYEDVLVEWYDIADSYKVYWRKVTNPESTWSSSSESTDNFYAFVGLEPDKQYEYKVHAFCGGVELTEQPEHVYTFTTRDEHELLVYGAIFGGGRMANVTGKTEVMVVNCDSIGAIYGGNDIAGEVLGAEGSTITLGNNSGTGAAITSSPVKVGSVYGGGNGYYAYNQPSGSVSFTPIQAGNTSVTVAPGHRVIGFNVLENQWANVVWTNSGTSDVTLTVPSIKKTAINVVNDYVKVDTIFGGAKNAFITANTGNGSDIAIDGGTIVSVFGGNNVGGSQGTGKHHIKVDEAEKTETANYLTRIHTLFGGGNKVAGSETDILVNGGMIDTLYAGGNSADVAAAKVEVNCALAEGSGENTFGHVYSSAIGSYSSSGGITITNNYPWNGTGVYNITALFGGNNQADMEVVPTITLTSGSVGTVYGGGNAGDMNGGVEEPGRIADDFGHLVFERTISNPADNETIVRKYSTYVELASPKMIIDYLYGGCQMSNVYYSSWIEMSDGHVGTVYGGCNISGDVGSRYLLEKGDPLLIEEGVSPDGTAYDLRPKHEKYQAVKGGTFVKVSGGHIYNDLFAGSNGRYHCNNGKVYVSGIDFDNLDTEGRYIGLPVPSHNETHVYVSDGEVDGNVYAGGNLACVGFINQTVPLAFYTPVFVGMATVRMSGGLVHGSVFGGGNMASIWGSNGVSVEGGTIEGALYGGNDRIGLVAQITNRVLPASYGKASDNYTSLEDVRTYISITGRPVVNTVYGGGNGDYDDYATGQYCNPNDQPVQSNTFVDVNIDGYVDGDIPAGHIHTVYGGGNGVTVTGTTTVFLNVKGDPDNGGAVAQGDHVDFIFGGNNKGPLAILPDIILLKGNVNTVYGGCNQGSMIGNHSVDNTYHNIGSLVRLRSSYPSVTGVPTAKVTGAVFGGCRMNGVDYNTLVLVEGGQHPASMFGGSDISGTISGTSQVVVTGGQTGNVYGGGNGNYDYDGTNVYVAGSSHTPENLVASGADDITAPVCNASGVDILGGQVGASGNDNARNVYGGGWGEESETTGNVIVTIGNPDAASLGATPTLFGDVYGGSALGVVNSSSTDKTNVNFFNGTIHGNVYGGGHGFAETNAYGYLNPNPTIAAIPAVVNGTVHVKIGSSAEANHSNYVNIDGKVFGGNNLAGSPQGNVFVDVYRTAHTTDNTCPGTVPTTFPDDASHYALSEVYGGGNLAHYEPTDENASTNVHIHNCENTIRYVYGGGNAANVPAANVTIDGGLVEYVFGGGNGAGEGNPGANVNGNNTIELNGGMIDYVFGGSNANGTVYGETSLSFATNPTCTRSVNELYGGGNQAADLNGITLNVPCGTADVKTIYGGARNADVGTSEQPADIVLNVYGGDSDLDAVFGGNNVGGTIYGNVTLNLYGGTIDKAFGGNNAGGDIKGTIQVNMEDHGGDCALGINTIYGGGNEAAYTPANASASPEVNIIHGTVNNAVYGGGKGVAATVTANPRVVIGDNDASHKAIVGALLNGSSTEGEGYVFGGGDAAAVIGTTTVIYQDGHDESQVKKIFGGGNNIVADNQGVTNAIVQINNGHVTSGIYGGCNTDGDVTGDVTVSLTNGTIGASGSGANIHGGGYGELTTVAGNVTVNFGANNNSPTGLILYGDLYGGSALGSVNTNASNTTTVNVYNGTIESPVPNPSPDSYANVFGGGLGDAGHEAMVYGVVHVNIGSETGGGNATLTHCNVFGCNNQNGSPQDDVFVDVYQTAHTLTDAADYFDNDRTYAIYQVFGGGNEADYRPENNLTTSSKKTHVTVHGCENTVRYVYGGSNAAYAVGVVNIILGGRFDEVYGGGNGRVHAADIGSGGIGLNVVAGNVSFLFEGSNKNGTNDGPFYKPDASSNCLGGLFVDSYFFGTNEAEFYGDLNNIITCAEAGNFEYRNVFAGSRWGIVYGDITLTVCGGIIENLFGGCRGYEDYSADVRRFPTFDEIAADIEAHSPADRKYSQDLLTHMGYPDGPQPSYAGHGGNIHLIVNGGTIGNVFGGCDIKGNVEGKISVTVCDVESTSCPLFVGNVYGASNLWYHNPEHSDINSPEVRILKGTVGGSHPDLPVNNIYGAVATDYEGNVFGGGNHGDVTANPRVIVGDGTTGATATRVTIKGDVYGGGNEGDVTGSPNVIVVPAMHTLTFSASTGGAVTVYNGQGSTVASGSHVGEGVDVQLIARPADYAHKFTGWTVNGAGASLSDPNAASTVLTMGTENVTVTANFTTVTTNTLTFNTSPTGGTFTVTGANGSVSSGSAVGEGVVLNLVATASPYGYKFKQWTVTGTGASVANDNAASTTFTMGTANATIVAEFEEVSHYALTITPASDGSFMVKDYQNTTVADGTDISAGALLYLEAMPASGYAFSGWTFTGVGASVANKDALETTFTMGTEASSITASFAPVHTLTVASPANGLIRVMDALGHTVNNDASIGEGAILNIKAMPHSGYAFKKWTVSGASVLNEDVPITSFTMGTTNATIDAEFVTAHILTINAPDEMVGTVKVTNPDLNQNVSSPASIGEEDVLNLQATHATGYHFAGWIIEGTGYTVGDAGSATTTFTMGTSNTTITATFEPD